jgi:hypothetical protein
MMCQVDTRMRRIARSANDSHPIEQHDARCTEHGIVSTGWPTQVAAQIAAEQHAATAAYGAPVSPR